MKEHLHEYDDNWKCKCGQKLVVDISEGRITIKGFMTPNGKFVPLSEAQGPAQSKRAKGATEGNQSDGDDSPEEE